MKKIEVVAAIIKKEDKILATKRGYGDFINLWEFPGGKIKKGETHQKALKREIKEELDALVSVNNLVCKVEYQYPSFHLTMHCYLCDLIKNEFSLKEHLDFKWLNKNNLKMLNWVPADIEVVDKILKTSLI